MRTAVLGAGLQGVCTALESARHGVAVDLFDQDATPFSRASLVNEAKVHLGLVYANDPTGATAAVMLDGALRFGPLLRRWTPGVRAPIATSRPFHYLVASDTLVAPDVLAAHYADLERLCRERLRDDARLDYLGARPNVLTRRLSAAELREWGSERVTAGFATVERSVNLPTELGHLRAALAASSVRFHPGRRVESVARTESGFRVESSGADGAEFIGCDQVVNALWNGRLELDATVGVLPDRPWTYRLKYRVLARLPKQLWGRPSITIVLGAYGDVVIHDDRTAYVSWYPEGMQGWSRDLAPPSSWDAACTGNAAPAAAAEIARRMLDGIDAFYPGIAAAETYQVDAGVIFAWGASDIDDPGSELHRRADIGVSSYDGYHTINTGKLTTAPMFALEAGRRVTAARVPAAT